MQVVWYLEEEMLCEKQNALLIKSSEAAVVSSSGKVLGNQVSCDSRVKTWYM